MVILVATRNHGKLRELRNYFQGTPVELKAPAEIGIEMPLVEESKGTFAGNALLKAGALARASGYWALADDSGLEVDALNGAPGINSARYAGPEASDKDNITKLLTAMAGKSERRARFRCVLALVKPTGEESIVEGTIEGEIRHAPIGNAGFGYDPIFLLPDQGRTFAQLSLEEKQQISHRAKAAEKLKAILERI